MVVFPDSACTSFTMHHLGEFECPHQYDVKVRAVFADPAQQAVFCKLASVNGSMFTIAPEFILPLFVQNPVPFVSDIMTGFFGDVVMANVSFVPSSVPFFAEYGLITNANLLYYLLPSNDQNDEFLLWHIITTPPDFDQLLRVTVGDGFSWPKGREMKWFCLIF